jgi:hypothetical protein
VAELEESALLEVRVLVRIEGVPDLDLSARTDLREGIREVHPLEAAVLEVFAGGSRAADRFQAAVELGGAERLVVVAELRERPVDAGCFGHHFPENALRDADLGAAAVGGPLRIDEVVHVGREVVAIGELGGHRAGGVENHEDVGLRSDVRLEQLPVVGQGRRRSGEKRREQHSQPDAPPGDHATETPQDSPTLLTAHCSLLTAHF